MDRERFEFLLDAYGADLRRWPEHERARAIAFAAQNGDAVADATRQAHRLDDMLDHARDTVDTASLSQRVLASAPRARSAVGGWALAALAACAVFGVMLGYSGAQLAPVADEDDSYFATAFEAPFADDGDEG